MRCSSSDSRVCCGFTRAFPSIAAASCCDVRWHLKLCHVERVAIMPGRIVFARPASGTQWSSARQTMLERHGTARYVSADGLCTENPMHDCVDFSTMFLCLEPSTSTQMRWGGSMMQPTMSYRHCRCALTVGSSTCTSPSPSPSPRRSVAAAGVYPKRGEFGVRRRLKHLAALSPWPLTTKGNAR
jgi:hypothetical protein